VVLSSGSSKITIEEAEKKNMVLDPRLGDKPISFGYLHEEWIKFKSQLKPGDELFEFFDPPPPGFPHGYGGYEIRRNGKVIATLITIS
jgi:hypothetical protein